MELGETDGGAATWPLRAGHVQRTDWWEGRSPSGHSMKAAQSNLESERSAALLGSRLQVWGGVLRSDVASRYLGYAHRLKCGAEARKWSESRPSRHNSPLIIARVPRNGSFPSVFRSTRTLFQPAVDCVGSLREVQGGTRIGQAPRATRVIPSPSPSMSLITYRF